MTSTSDKDYGAAVQLFTNGDRIDSSASRLPDEAIVINEDCVGLLDPEFNCVGFRSYKEAFSVFPVCWDRNDTVRRPLLPLLCAPSPAASSR